MAALQTIERKRRSLLRDQRGATAVVFAASAATLATLSVGLFGAYQAQSERTKLQDALDAATLYAARSTATEDPALTAIGAAALRANLAAEPRNASFVLDGDKVIGHAEIAAPGLFAAIRPANLSADAEVMRGMNRIEVALVLDNTGSMQGTKLATLKAAAESLVTKLDAAKIRSVEPDPVKISLVPFSNTVRVLPTVALTNYNAATHSGPGVPAWLDPRGQAHAKNGINNDIFSPAKTDRLAELKDMKVSWNGCVESRRGTHDQQAKAPNAADVETLFTPYFWPDEPNADAYNTYASYSGGGTWKDDLRDLAKYPTKAPTGTFTLDGTSYGKSFDKGPNAGCSLQPVIPLTTNLETIKTGVSAMNAIGETNIAAGLLWGYNTLNPEYAYFSGPQPAAFGTDKLRKIIILMTDGENTFNAPGRGSLGSFYGGLGYIWQGVLGISSGSSAQRTGAMNSRLSALCQTVKAKGVLIYTVRVEVRSGSSELLRNCATRADMFYDVQNVSQLTTVFDAIAGSIDNLRIAK